MQNMGAYLGTTKDGYLVYDRKMSHIHYEGGISREIISQALKWMYANGAKFKKKEICFPKTIGVCNCVPTTSNDEIVMVYRKGRAGQTPMVKNRTAVPSNTITIIIKKNMDCPNSYTLISCYVGSGSMREPWDKAIFSEEERRKCEEYWSKHALIYNECSIDWDRM